MTSIVFERTGRAYLPEISAYRRYLSEHFPDVKTHDTADISSYNPMDYDIVWRFPGLDMKGQGKFVVHDYNSLSTPPWPHWKNIIKKVVNKKPDMRVFLNEDVRKEFGFHDKVPSHIRDMGIDESFYTPKKKRKGQKEYDFVYVGSLNRGAVVDAMLSRFSGPLHDMSLLVLGRVPKSIRDKYGPYPNISFVGELRYEEVPFYMGYATYGLNIMPDVYPYYMQTSTKVLEYCAANLKIITTGYHWIKSFEEERLGRFMYLETDLKSLTRDRLENFDFITPNVDDLRWNRVIENSDVFNFLKK